MSYFYDDDDDDESRNEDAPLETRSIERLRKSSSQAFHSYQH